jgi:hypothetical protein
VGGDFYWYGENKEFTTGETDVWTWGVRCYRSRDLNRRAVKGRETLPTGMQFEYLYRFVATRFDRLLSAILWEEATFSRFFRCEISAIFLCGAARRRGV